MQLKPIRQVKLYGKYRPSKDWRSASGQSVPWLNVSGRWLEQAGFHIDDPIEISVSNNQLIIKHRNVHGN
jgi:toxic protein SymE